MDTLVAEHQHAIRRLCAEHQVKRLDLFGSATGTAFDPERSDVDFVVEFAELSPRDYAHHYFGLKEGLVALLRRPVDLVVERAIRNPYFRQSVDASREPLFAA